MIELTQEEIEHYYHDYRSFVEAAYRDWYEQALKDMEHFEETGVVII